MKAKLDKLQWSILIFMALFGAVGILYSKPVSSYIGEFLLLAFGVGCLWSIFTTINSISKNKEDK
ncbi:MAG: hypothetical protein HZA36_03265 [Parcubacteria group bacterium]|nr:hypothetical protein [Parcubacteria group bacterium]